MKVKSIFFVSIVILSVSLFTSCKYNTEIAHPEKYTSVYMPEAKGNPVVKNLIMTDSSQIITYSAYYAGTGYPSEDMTVNFEVDTSLVKSFNTKNHTNYSPMPVGSYQLESTSATIPKGKVSTQPLSLKIKTLGVLDSAKKYLLPVRIKNAENDSVSANFGITYYLISANYEYVNVFMGNGGNKPVGKSLIGSDTDRTITFQAEYNGADPGNDIKIYFEVDTTLTDSFNSRNGTNYSSLPGGSYELSQTTATIKEGTAVTKSIPVKIKTNSYLKPLKKYLLPIRIDTVKGDLDVSKKLSIEKDKRNIYFLIVTKHGSVVIKVMCFAKNSGDTNLQAIADYINGVDPDLLVVRQLDVNTSRIPVDQPQKLSQLVKMPHYAFATGLHYQGGEYGTALFSKFPINSSETKTYMLPSSSSEKAPLAIIQTKVNKYLHLYLAGTQLNADDNNRNSNQVPPLMDYMSNYNGPMILAGDFNSYPSKMGYTFDQLTKQFTLPCINCSSYSLYAGNYIVYKPAINFETLNYQIIDKKDNPVSKYYTAILKVKIYY